MSPSTAMAFTIKDTTGIENGVLILWCWLAIASIGSVSAAAEMENPLELHFRESCSVSRVAWARERLFLLLTNSRAPGPGMVVYVEDGRLFHWSDRLAIEDIRGLGHDVAGGLILVSRIYLGRAARLSFAALDPGLVCSSGSRVVLDPEYDERLVTFLPSRPGMFLTNRHIGMAVGSRWVENLSEPLHRFTGAADVSGDVVLAGRSASKEAAFGNSDVFGACLWQVGVRTREVRKVELKGTATRPGDAPDAGIQPFSVSLDQVASIVADARNEGWFYVAIGSPIKGGRLLRIGPDDECEVVFQRLTGPYSEIGGEPIDSPPPNRPPFGLSPEEGVLAMAYDRRKRLHFVTPRGVYRLTDGNAEFIGTPEFEEVGGFFIARNISGFAVILSQQGDHAKRFSRVFMVSTDEPVLNDKPGQGALK